MALNSNKEMRTIIKRIIQLILLAMTGLVITTGLTSAQPDLPAEGDARVATALDQLNYRYQVTPAGTFRIVMNIDDDRQQLLLINSKTETLGNLEIREILSPAYQSNGSLSESIANQLLENSTLQKLAAWQVLKNNETRVAVLTAKIAADLDAQTLQSSMSAVVKSADDMEKELTGLDSF